MAARTDLLLDKNGDLPIGAKLMTVGPSDERHQLDMFAAFPGEWKQFPFNGIGIRRYLKSGGNSLLFLKSNARQMLQRDGYSVGNLTATFNDNVNKLKIVSRATR